VDETEIPDSNLKPADYLNVAELKTVPNLPESAMDGNASQIPEMEMPGEDLEVKALAAVELISAWRALAVNSLNLCPMNCPPRLPRTTNPMKCPSYQCQYVQKICSVCPGLQC
jgi:hypothetical protein